MAKGLPAASGSLRLGPKAPRRGRFDRQTHVIARPSPQPLLAEGRRERFRTHSPQAASGVKPHHRPRNPGSARCVRMRAEHGPEHQVQDQRHDEGHHPWAQAEQSRRPPASSPPPAGATRNVAPRRPSSCFCRKKWWRGQSCRHLSPNSDKCSHFVLDSPQRSWHLSTQRRLVGGGRCNHKSRRMLYGADAERRAAFRSGPGGCGR